MERALLFLFFIFGSVLAMEDWETWPLERLEQQVSPSRWNPSKSPDEVIKEYVDVSIQGTLKAQENVPHELNIPYGSKSTQQYDIYGTDLPENAPIFLWIHGGYWQEGSKDISGLFAINLHSKGIRNIVLGYTLAPKASIKEIEQETHAALKHIFQRFPNSKITVGGHSAGAQLAAMLLHTNSGFPELYEKVTGLVLVSGLYDLRPLIPTYVNGALKLSRTDAERSSPLKIRHINPEFRKMANFTIKIWVGKNDSPEFQRQSQEYYKLLKGTFPKTEFWKSKSDDHFTLVENMAQDSTDSGKQFSQFAETLETPGNTANTQQAKTFLLATLSILLLSFL